MINEKLSQKIKLIKNARFYERNIFIPYHIGITSIIIDLLKKLIIELHLGAFNDGIKSIDLVKKKVLFVLNLHLPF